MQQPRPLESAAAAPAPQQQPGAGDAKRIARAPALGGMRGARPQGGDSREEQEAAVAAPGAAHRDGGGAPRMVVPTPTLVQFPPEAGQQGRVVVSFVAARGCQSAVVTGACAQGGGGERRVARA